MQKRNQGNHRWFFFLFDHPMWEWSKSIDCFQKDVEFITAVNKDALKTIPNISEETMKEYV